MKIIQSIQEMNTWSKNVRHSGRTLGFVPTMGYLHEGHLSLVRESKNTCDTTVVSIFVNPKQFGPGEDLDTYPANWEQDRSYLEKLNVDAVFLPQLEDMYPDGFKTYVAVESITDALCGKSRPGFFKGVTTIVLKLFNIVQPDQAFFGEKDRQQLQVIRTLVRDLNLNVKITGLPIIREPDGIAMSSRNAYLNADQRLSARSLSQALESAQELIECGETSAEKIRQHIRGQIEGQGDARIDYISVCHPDHFEEVEVIEEEVVIALAVYVGPARLIDNCLIERIPCKG